MIIVILWIEYLTDWGKFFVLSNEFLTFQIDNSLKEYRIIFVGILNCNYNYTKYKLYYIKRKRHFIRIDLIVKKKEIIVIYRITEFKWLSITEENKNTIKQILTKL